MPDVRGDLGRAGSSKEDAVKDESRLASLHQSATEYAREHGVRQRIVWMRYQGWLAPCSSDFDAGFCCGDKPYTGWAWPIRRDETP